jgi:hypothetical protein
MVMDEWGEGEDPNLHVPFFANFLAKQRDTEHSGDCRKEPWSCSRCICDEYLKKADELLSAFPQPDAEPEYYSYEDMDGTTTRRVI